MVVRLWSAENVVNSTTLGNQSGAISTALKNGGYVVCWVEAEGSTASIIKFQRFDAASNKLGLESAVPASAPGTYLSNPSITTLDDGSFVIASNQTEETLTEVVFSRFDSSGNYIGTNVTNPEGHSPEVASRPGGFTLAYVTSGPNDRPFVISYDLSGNITGGANITGNSGDAYPSTNAQEVSFSEDRFGNDVAIYVDQIAGLDQLNFRKANVSSSPIGIFSAAPLSLGASNSISDIHIQNIEADDIFGVRYAVTFTIGLQTAFALLNPDGADLFLNYVAGANGDIQLLSNGTLFFIWHALASDGTIDIRLQQYDLIGNKVGIEIVVNTSSAAIAVSPAVTELADGRVVVTWTDTSALGDGSGSAIFQQIFDPRDGLVTGSDLAVIAETLYGHESYNDQIRGMAGNDTIYGLAGSDVIYGGDGLDTLFGGRGDDTIYGGADRDLIYGELGDDELNGDAGNDYLNGANGFDRMLGGIGDDSIYGEANDDFLIGGLGQDYLDGGAGFDFASYETAAQGIRVDMVFRSGNTFDAIGDTFVNIEGLTGSNSADFLTSTYGDDTVHGGGGADYIDARSGNDILFGSAGYDQIYAGDGNDTLEGGLDNDYLDGGNGIDTVSYASAGAAVIADLVAIASNSGEAAGDVYYQVENLLGSIFGDQLRGTDGDNTLTGGDGDDTLWARGGADTLIGGNGVDTLYGLNGIDILDGGADNDIMDGGADFDTFRYTAPSFGQDTINLFQDGIDKFGVSAAGYSFSSFAITQAGANTLMTLTSSPSQTITLTNFTATNITLADFL